MFDALINFFDALIFGKDILLTYLTLVMITSSIAMILFQDELSIVNVNDFAQINRAIVTMFILLTTGENYNDIIYP